MIKQSHTMKIAIIGSRTIASADIERYLPTDCTCIISGGAKGVDTISAEYARTNGIELVEMLPDYSKYGRGATHIRNRAIVEASDMVLAFWDGKSKGTISTVNYAKKTSKPFHIVNCC